MPITLVTGTPGAGKTLFAVKKVIEELIPTGRKIYVNINGFTHDSPNVVVVGDEAPKEWMKYPDGGFFVFDEVQRQYPHKNSMTKTPDYISGYETHRHRGMDFIFITQGPYLIDRHLHPLIDHHYHIYRPFGFKRSTILEWQGVNPTPAPLQSRTNAAVRNFSFPKKYFDHYKSATIHTVQRRIPWKLFGIFGLVALGLCVVAYLGYRSSQSDLLNKYRRGSSEESGAAQLERDLAASDPAKCAAILARTPSDLVIRIQGHRSRLRADAVTVAEGRLVVGGNTELSWPLCRVTQ